MPTVLITGANRGLGLEFARQYATNGWHVIACCRTPHTAEELQAYAQKHQTIQIETLDVADLNALSMLGDKLKKVAIDVLINNAGILSGIHSSASAGSGDSSQEFGAVDPAGWHKVMQVNVLAPLKITEAFVSQVAKSQHRKIIMISSGWGSIEHMDGSFYAYKVSKAALNAVTKNLASDLKKQKICVVSFSPGWVKTDMGGQEADISPESSVSSMCKTIAQLTLAQSGQFLNREGAIYPW